VKGKGNQVWVAWADAPTGNPTSNVPDIYVRGSSDGGTSFGDTVNIPTAELSTQTNPESASRTWLFPFLGRTRFLQRCVPLLSGTCDSRAPASMLS
jgi:hypothetical protein